MSNLGKALQVEYPEVVAQLRHLFPDELQRFSNVEIEKIYKTFSNDYAASWLCLTEEFLQRFREWLDS